MMNNDGRERQRSQIRPLLCETSPNCGVLMQPTDRYLLSDSRSDGSDEFEFEFCKGRFLFQKKILLPPLEEHGFDSRKGY
jgi:hypothetical protein